MHNCGNCVLPVSILQRDIKSTSARKPRPHVSSVNTTYLLEQFYVHREIVQKVRSSHLPLLSNPSPTINTPTRAVHGTYYHSKYVDHIRDHSRWAFFFLAFFMWKISNMQKEYIKLMLHARVSVSVPEVVSLGSVRLIPKQSHKQGLWECLYRGSHLVPEPRLSRHRVAFPHPEKWNFLTQTTAHLMRVRARSGHTGGNSFPQHCSHFQIHAALVPVWSLHQDFRSLRHGSERGALVICSVFLFLCLRNIWHIVVTWQTFKITCWVQLN